MTDNDEYAYEVIDNEIDARVCAQVLAEEFAAHNLITLFDRITSQCFFDTCSWPIIADVLDERLSFLARHRSSGEIVGAIYAEDMYLTHEKYPFKACSSPAVIPVNDLLDEMNEAFVSRDFGQELKPHMVLHISLCAVRAQHSGKGVASRLCIAACEHARNTRGFQYGFVQVTNPATQHIYLEKMRGEKVSIVDPTLWIWKKHGDGLSRPYQEYTGGTIPNILFKLTRN